METGNCEKSEVIRLCRISKSYPCAEGELKVLKDISLVVTKGEFVCVMGPSGSGKSTLMNIVGCLDTPTEGEYYIRGSNVFGMNDNELAGIRNREIGFVFQSFNLLPRLNAVENVEIPMLFAGVPSKLRRTRAMQALERVGLLERFSHLPSELSGGQRQRVAIARALINSPSIIVADEPTGNLDTRSSDEILSLFTELNSAGHTILMVTHDDEVAMNGSRIIRIRDGMVEYDENIKQF